MYDRSGVLEYVFCVKKYEKILEFSEFGYGVFILSYRIFFEEYC